MWACQFTASAGLFLTLSICATCREARPSREVGWLFQFHYAVAHFKAVWPAPATCPPLLGTAISGFIDSAAALSVRILLRSWPVCSHHFPSAFGSIGSEVSWHDSALSWPWQHTHSVVVIGKVGTAFQKAGTWEADCPSQLPQATMLSISAALLMRESFICSRHR